MRGALIAALIVPLLAAPAPLGAQAFTFTPRVQPEMRLEAAVAHHAGALVMAGANFPLGLYVRAGLSAGVGVAFTDGAGLATGADLTFRFLLDPFGESAWGPYAGGGLTVRRDGWERPRAGLMMVLGVEGRRARRWVPAIEAGLGEGARLAV